MPITRPWGIAGIVTVGGTAIQGAKVWAVSEGYYTHKNTVKDITYFYTDSSGKYLIDLANIVSTITNGDVIHVTCQAGEDKMYTNVTVDTTIAGTTQNFAFSNKAGLVDGCKDTINTDGTGALLHNALRKGCKDGMS